MSIVQKDISNLEAQPELPDTYAKEGDFLRVKIDGSGDTEWFDSNTGSVSIGTGLFSDGSVSNPSITFQSDTNTGIYRVGADDIGITTGGITRMALNGSSVEVGTLSNNLNFNVNGNSSATNFRAGNGLVSTPSYSFTTGNGQDCGMYYDAPSGNDRLNFAVNGSNILQLGLSTGVSNLNNKLLLNGGSSTNPSVAINATAFGTGFSADTSNNLWTLTAGSINTTHTPTSFDVGRTISNNLDMKTFNANGPSNFNSFTIDYNLILTPTTSTANSLNTGVYQDIAVDEVNGWYAYTASTSTAGQARLLVNTTANTLTAWTGITNSDINMNNVRNVAYGNGVWAVCSGSSLSRQLYYTTAVQPTTGWTQVQNSAPWTTTRQINRLKFVNGQFITLDTGTRFRTSIDCSDGSWSSDLALATGTFSITDITYSPELQRYVATATSGGTIWYYNGTTMPTTANQFTAVTVSGGASNTIAWSSKLGMFIAQNFSTFVINYSRDGINWSSYTPTGTWASIQHIRWVNDFGGFFMASVAQTGNNLAISRDGLNWSFIQTGVATAVYGIAYNQTSKVFLFTGTATTNRFKDALTDFNNYVDSDAIYNTFNSNTRFADVIEYQNQVITPVSGNNHYTTSHFTRPEIVFDTTSSNANIYLQGASFNGRVGCKFKFIKSNSNNNVRIHGFETTTLISQTGNVTSFNAQSSPQFYAIIPSGYFGSFELTRVSDFSNGIWVIDNVDVYDSAGSSLQISNLNVSGNLTVSGSISGFTSLNNANLTGTCSFERVVYNSQDLFGTVTISTVNLSHHYVRCYTSSGNVNIELAGSTGNNTEVGTRFKFQKMDIANIVRLSGSATTSPAIQTPMITVSSFTNISSPNVITIIPANYLGSFELVRIDTNVNGNWRVENLQIFNASAQTFLDTNLIVNKNLTSNGILTVDSPGQTSTINHNLEVSGYLRYPIEDIREITWNTGYDVKLPDMLSLGKYNYFISAGTTPSIYLQNINNVVYDNFTFNFCIAENGTTSTNYQIQNDMGGSHIVKVYKTGAITTLTATQTTTIDMHQWTRCTYKHNYRSGNNYWLVHHYNSDV